MLIKHWLSNRRRNHQVALILSAILASIIGYFTLTPSSANFLTGSDKLGHLLGFTVLMIPGAFLYRHALYWLFPSAIAFGGAIELIQPYVNRQAELADFGADVAGALLGMLIGLSVRYFFHLGTLNTPSDAS